MYMPMVHIFLLMTSFIKLLYNMRINAEFGRFVELILNCVWDVRIFFYFFMAWVIMFSIIFKVSGAEFDDEDYPTLPGGAFLIQTYRNSIGDIAPPKYEYWKKFHDKYDPNRIGGYY